MKHTEYTPERIIKSNKMRDEIIRILEDCPDMSAVYPLLHFMEQECNQAEQFWEMAHAHTECKLKDEIDQLKKENEELRRRSNLNYGGGFTDEEFNGRFFLP